MTIDIRTLGTGDVFGLFEDDPESLRVIHSRDDQGLWTMPLNCDDASEMPQLYLPAGSNSSALIEVYDVNRLRPPTLSIHIDESGGDWAEVIYDPTGEVIRRAHEQECFEFVCENVCVEITKDRKIVGPRL